MSNTPNAIRQQLLVGGMIRPAINTKGEARADAVAVAERKHEFIGRKTERAMGILRDNVRKAKRAQRDERNERKQA